MAHTLALIICTYRRAEAMGRLLKSLREQTLLPQEILVIDASADTCTEQLVSVEQHAWQSGQLLYYRVTEEHRGLTRQRNYGIARAQGEIIAFLDDDTIPDPHYLEEILSCFDRHPQAIGVGGFITNEALWRPVKGQTKSALSIFRWNDWEVREDYRWRARKILGLASALPPGWMPPSGHGRSVGFIPPDGQDYQVESLMGGASAWKRSVFRQHQFSSYFEGYGLYEDLDFGIRVSQTGPLYLCTRARLAHYHAASGRPGYFHYGQMVVRNGWLVWRRRWPTPDRKARLSWWATTFLLLFFRLLDARGFARWRNSVVEATGRLWGATTLLWDEPRER